MLIFCSLFLVQVEKEELAKADEVEQQWSSNVPEQEAVVPATEVRCCIHLFIKSRPTYQAEKKVYQRLVCQMREFAARSSSCEVSSMKFSWHSYFSAFILLKHIV